MRSLSVVIPVKDGERYLDELLSALGREEVDEVLVIDSGSTDASVAIARSYGVEILAIPPGEFGHGRTRNLGAQSTSGELIAFLTQDATPCPGWRRAYEEAFDLDVRVGAAYGPHLPRPSSSPMVARELTEFFASFSPDGLARVQRVGDPSFLSNVNACYARQCWQEIHFREIAYSEDQAFGRDLFAAGWAKVYHPAAAVLHAHDYGWGDFMRRYFDEYRGLRSTIGHVEPLAPRRTIPRVVRQVRADLAWSRQDGAPVAAQGRLAARSAAHHGGRAVFSSLGSRSQFLPEAVRGRISLERRGETAAPAAAPSSPQLPPFTHVGARIGQDDYSVAARVWREGPAPLLPSPPGLSSRQRLRIALVIPPFGRGSGGHNTLFQIFRRLEQRGHVCSVWIHDYVGETRNRWPAVLRREIREWFAPIDAPVYSGFDEWQGADVVLATGWQTAHPVLALEGCHARAYVVNDHEPGFYATSMEELLARDTYSHGMHCIAASPWLRDLLHERYGASADAFQLGVDHATYRMHPGLRRRDMVIYYARHATPRRAVPLGLMALGELHRRDPTVRIVMFGTGSPIVTTFPYEHAGILSPEQLSVLYSQATVGLCLSLTNFSLMPKEMLACGLPCVELAGVSAESIFGSDGPIELAPARPELIAGAIQRLLNDSELWERRSREGAELVASHTWDRATDEVEEGIRHALRSREQPSG